MNKSLSPKLDIPVAVRRSSFNSPSSKLGVKEGIELLKQIGYKP